MSDVAESPWPDHIGVSEVTTASFEQMRVEAFFEGQPSIMFDEPEGFDIGDPPELQGRSRGWTPVHAQLAALAACTSITVAVVARDQQFLHSGLRTGIRSLIDIRGFFFDLHLQPKFEEVSFDLWLETGESESRIKALADETDRRCPQLGLFRLASIPLIMRWHKNGVLAHEARFGLGPGATPDERLRLEKAGT